MRVAMEMGSELDYGVVVGMEWCMEFCIDGACSEMERRNIPEMECGNILEMVAESYVPLQCLNFSKKVETAKTNCDYISYWLYNQ